MSNGIILKSNGDEFPFFKPKQLRQAATIVSVHVLTDGNGRLLVEPGLHSDISSQLSVPTPTMRAIEVSAVYLKKHAPYSGGVYVKYPDGYESFCPYYEFVNGHEPYPKESLAGGMNARMDAGGNK